MRKREDEATEGIAAKASIKDLVAKKKALVFFQKKLRSIEVAWGAGGLSTVYFPMPPEGDHMNEEIMDDLGNKLSFASDDRVKDMAKMVPQLLDELRWHATLQKLHIPQKQSTNKLNEATFAVSLAINFLMVISLRYEEDATFPTYHSKQIEDYVWYLGVLSVFLAGAKVIHITFFKLPVMYKHMERDRNKAKRFNTVSLDDKRNALTNALKAPVGLAIVTYAIVKVCEVNYGTEVFKDSTTAYFLYLLYTYNGFSALTAINNVSVGTAYSTRFFFWYSLGFKGVQLIRFYGFMMGCAVVGLVFREYPLMYSIQLFTIVPMSPILVSVTRAVTIPGAQLGMSAVLGLIIIYSFALVAFYFFKSSMQHQPNDDGTPGDNECETMLRCLKSFVKNGVMYGGGIGDFINGDLDNTPELGDEELYMKRFVFDLMFFVVVIVLLLNIIFGIIIDTFSSERENMNEKIAVKLNRCFICGLNRDAFEDMKQMGGKGFVHHWKSEHNLFDYMYFMMYLQNKSSTDFNGAESYVSSCVEKEDIGWIPDGVAVSIPRVDVAAERERKMEEWFKGMRDRSMGQQQVITGELSKLAGSIERQFGLMKKQIGVLKSEVKALKGKTEEALLKTK